MEYVILADDTLYSSELIL